MMPVLTLLFGLLTLFYPSRAQNHSTICAWSGSRAGTVRGKLYIDGGVPYNNTWEASSWESDNSISWGARGYLYSFDYGTPFRFNDEPPDIDRLLGKDPLTVTGARYDAPLYTDGAMFVDDYELYTFGGMPTSGESGSTILNYQLFPVDGQLDQPGPNLDYSLSTVDNYVMGGAGVSLPSANVSFYFSGLRNSTGGPLSAILDYNDPDPYTYTISDTMIQVDTSSQEAKWEEISLSGAGIPGRVDGQLVWVPVSQEGILLAIGGVIYPQDRYGYSLSADQTSESKQDSPGFMTTIAIHDIYTGVWYNQTTAGDDHPGQLSKFCAVVAGKPGDSTFEIFIYGGDNGLALSNAVYAYDEVWVLSVPSFTWTKAKDASEGHGRSGHICSLPLPSQMLVFGGQAFSDPGLCISDGNVIDVFDLNKLEWTHDYDPQATQEYATPSKIRTEPAASLEAGVGDLFNAPYPGEIKIWYPYKQEDSEENSPKPSVPIAAIAGGAAGGGVVLLIIAFLAWYCWPSRVKKRRSRRSSGTGSSTTFISHWRRGIMRPSTDMAVVPKDVSSDSTMEVDSQMSPPAAAEAYGDHYFHPHHSSSPSAHGTPAEGQLSPSRSPGRVSYQSGPPRSPRSLQAGSIEADGDEVHEKDGVVRTSNLSDLGQGPVDFRKHPQYPYSIDRVAHSEHGSHTRNPLGSNVSHATIGSHSRKHSHNIPSPIGSGSAHEVDNGNANANEMGTSTIRPGMLPRYSSGISSELPLTPQAIHERLDEEIRVEMQMRPTSGPLPMMMQYHADDTEDGKDAEADGNPALSTGDGAVMSPSSAYSTLPPRNPEQDLATDNSLSTSNTLRGDALSPMTEKMNLHATNPNLNPSTSANPSANPAAGVGVARLSMTNVAAALAESPTTTQAGTASARSTRRKPVGDSQWGPGMGMGLGVGLAMSGKRSAYEENQRRQYQS